MAERLTRTFFEQTRTNNLNSVERYKKYWEFFKDKQTLASVYFSTAITSGGFVHVYDDPTKTQRENSLLGNQFIGELSKDYSISESDIISPLDTEEKFKKEDENNWTEIDYMLFWFHIMSGISSEDASLVEKYVRGKVDFESDNPNLSHEDRRKKYEEFTSEYVRYLEKGSIEKDPIQEVIQLVDTRSSLGCFAEELFAKHLGITVRKAIVNRSSKIFDINGLEELTKAGAIIPHFTFSHDNALILVG